MSTAAEVVLARYAFLRKGFDANKVRHTVDANGKRYVWYDAFVEVYDALAALRETVTTIDTWPPTKP